MVLSMLTLWVTVLTGVVLLAFWSPIDDDEGQTRPVTAAVVHISLALFAVGAWTLYVIGRSRVLATASLALLAATLLAGATTIVLTRRRTRLHGDDGHVGAPIPALVIHGALAGLGALAATLVFLTT